MGPVRLLAADAEHARLLRAEARRTRMAVVRARLEDKPTEPGLFGFEGMVLAAKLSFAAAAFAGQTLPQGPRSAIAIRWVPARLRDPFRRSSWMQPNGSSWWGIVAPSRCTDTDPRAVWVSGWHSVAATYHRHALRE